MLRFAARFGFTIDAATWEAAKAAAPELKRLSAERVHDEWFKGLETARSVVELTRGWLEVGAARVWIPELYDAAQIIEPVTDRDPVVLTAALCRAAPEVLARLKASNAEIMRVQALSRGPVEPGSAKPVAVRRWLAGVGEAADDLIRLAEIRRGSPPSWAAAVEQSRARGEPTSRGQLALSGDDLRAAGVQPGPEMGRLLEQMLDAVLEDPARNTRESLLALVKSWR
jgi:tRNA nucleotidyltransferase (CCA-adding enzyme)